MRDNSDLTTGGILQKLVFVALPLMGTQLVQMLYNLTDMFWLGRLSSDHVAASGVSGMYMWLSMALLMIGRMGAEIGVSQNKGRGDMDRAQAFTQNAWLLSVAFGLLYGALLVIFNKPLLSVYHLQDVYVRDEAARYLQIVGLGIPATYMSAVFVGTFNGSGNSRTPFYINAIGLVTNMIADPLMIFSLGLGIRGAAAATVLAQWLVTGLLALAVRKHRDRPFAAFRLRLRPSASIIREIIRWSLPIAIESCLFTMLSMGVTRVVSGFGADALAVQRVGTQVESLSWLIAGGFGSAMTAFIGQNYGARQWGRIGKGFSMASRAMILWGCVTTATLFFGGYTLISLFLMEDRLRITGAAFMRILTVSQIAACLEGVGAGYFRGSGRTTPPSMTSILCNALRIPLSYWLTKTSLGINGVWWTLSLTALARGSVIYLWALVDLSGRRRHNIDKQRFAYYNDLR